MSIKINPKKLLAAQLLGEGYSGKKVAKLLKIRQETLSRWKHSDVFIAQIDAYTAQLRGKLQQRVLQLLDKSISTIIDEVETKTDYDTPLEQAMHVLMQLDVPRHIAPLLTLAPQEKPGQEEVTRNP